MKGKGKRERKMLAKLFIKDYKNVNEPKVRNAYGILATVVGLICNVILCAAKIAVGVLSKSMAILADGLNNFTDAGSSVVSMLGFRWANKPADKEHPFGHARYEYITGLIIAFIVLFLGFELIVSSVEKITAGEKTVATVIMMAVLAFSVVVKFGMFFYYRSVSRKIGSGSLKAAGADSLNDCISTIAILVCTVITYFTGVELDGYVGIAVALFIVFNGIKLIKETMSPLLGEKPSPSLVKKISEEICAYDGVKGIHDLIVHNYGPGRYFASVHVEVDARTDVLESHELADTIEREFLEKGINLVIHMDPVIVDDERVNALKQIAVDALKNIDESLTLHDFRVVWGENRKNLIFDVVVPYGFRLTDKELTDSLDEKIKETDPAAYPVISVDKDFAGR